MIFEGPSDTGFECEFCLHENDSLFPCNKCSTRGGKKLLFKEKILVPPVKPPKGKTNQPSLIDVMVEVFGVEAVKNFCFLNAFKCLWKSEKETAKEDVENAAWYLNKYIELGDEDE